MKGRDRKHVDTTRARHKRDLNRRYMRGVFDIVALLALHDRDGARVLRLNEQATSLTSTTTDRRRGMAG